MMKKKVINTILLTIVVIIWVAVISKSKGFFSSNEPDGIAYQASTPLPDNYLIFEKDTFDLAEIRRDPFFKSKAKPVTKRVPVQEKTPSTKKKIKKKVTDQKWPKLKYFGFIHSKKKGERNLAMIKVNNKLFRAREQERIEEVILKRVFNDSILLELNGDLKMVYR